MATLEDECAWFLEKLKYYDRRLESCKDQTDY